LKALLFMGCPQVPVQTPAVLYIANKLKNEGFEVIASGNKAAISLIHSSDPEKHYISKLIDLDKCIADISEKLIDFDIIVVFIHNDSGITYLETLKSLSKAKVLAVVFGKHAETFVKEAGDCVIASANSTHNIIKLKMEINKVKSWAVLKN